MVAVAMGAIAVDRPADRIGRALGLLAG